MYVCVYIHVNTYTICVEADVSSGFNNFNHSHMMNLDEFGLFMICLWVCHIYIIIYTYHIISWGNFL